mgnify:CR=1 FL=1
MSRHDNPSAFLHRVHAMMVKEFLQLIRDRVTFATMIAIPLVQLILFGYAINTTPRNLPAAVFAHENTDAGRAILSAVRNTAFFRFVREVRSAEEGEHLLRSGDVLFFVEIPARFERGPAFGGGGPGRGEPGVPPPPPAPPVGGGPPPAATIPPAPASSTSCRACSAQSSP